jgi:hypothetical protein
MQHKIMNKETGAVVPLGTMLHTSHPSARPGTWRLENHALRNGEHTLHVSRSHHRMGRVHREFHPHVFGLTVEIEVTWYRATTRKIHKAWHETYTGVYLGFLALIGLAFFENYHLAPAIVEYVSFGLFGGSGH